MNWASPGLRADENQGDIAMCSLRFALGFAALLVAALLSLPAAAQPGYPNKPIRMIVPLAAASAVDNAARIIAQKMSANMGQQIVIENQQRGKSASEAKT